ncbi:MAG: ComF family protein [Verrucomicrobia bacterium]|nr:ComF family protein [Verrucomicrobiota bacterium]
MLFQIPKLLRGAGSAFLDLLYPPHCTLCLCKTTAGEHLCATCRKKAPVIRAPFCDTCSQPFPGQIESAFLCPNCRERHFEFTCAVACYQSRDGVREVVHRFKYNGKIYLRHVLVDWLAETLKDPRLQTPACDRIVPVPLHPTRERERGFNQAHILAEGLARRSGIPLAHCLKRIRYTTTQTIFDREERMENLRGAFQLRQSAQVRNLHLLLIDDVLTTGSTVDECARVLRDAGAASVRVATVARA